MLEIVIDQAFPHLFGGEEIAYSVAFDHTKKEFSLRKLPIEGESMANDHLEGNEVFTKAPEHLRYKLLKGIEELTDAERERVADYVGTTPKHIIISDMWLQGEFVELI